MRYTKADVFKTTKGSLAKFVEINTEYKRQRFLERCRRNAKEGLKNLPRKRPTWYSEWMFETRKRLGKRIPNEFIATNIPRMTFDWLLFWWNGLKKCKKPFIEWVQKKIPSKVFIKTLVIQKIVYNRSLIKVYTSEI